jgi:hypothetical protein
VGNVVLLDVAVVVVDVVVVDVVVVEVVVVEVVVGGAAFGLACPPHAPPKTIKADVATAAMTRRPPCARLIEVPSYTPPALMYLQE